MAVYQQRTEAPKTSNKNFIHTSFKGYNKCIVINNKNGFVLANCVGYCWGRWREILGYEPRLSRGNAEDWYGNKSDGYKRGQTPKLGAVICWKKGQVWNGNDGYGHVAIVEEIKSNGDIVVSESMYGSTMWRRHTYTKSSGYYLGSKYEFQGFIYLPVEFEAPKTKAIADILSNLKLDKRTMIVTAGVNENVVLSANNIPNVNVTYADVLGTYDVVANSKLYITKDAIKKLEEAYK